MSRPPTLKVLNQEWDPDIPSQDNTIRLARIMQVQNTKQKNQIKKMKTINTDSEEEPKLSTVYAKKGRQWIQMGWRCLDCGKVFSELAITKQHPKICDKALKINREEDSIMPVRRVMKNGVPYFQWGTEGKLYKTQKEAEEQGRAIYAAGYRKAEEKK
jgi:hypothetical protein